MTFADYMAKKNNMFTQSLVAFAKLQEESVSRKCIIARDYKTYKDKNNSYPYLKVINLSVRRSLLLLRHCLAVPERRPYPWLTLERSGSRRAMQGDDDTDYA